MTSAKEIRLWDDGTYSEGGGHWIAVRIEEWGEMRDIIAAARKVVKVQAHLPPSSKIRQLERWIKRMDDNVKKAKANR